MALVESLSPAGGSMPSGLADRSGGPTSLQSQTLQVLQHQQSLQHQQTRQQNQVIQHQSLQHQNLQTHQSSSQQGPHQKPSDAQQKVAEPEQEQEEPVIDIVINNVVSSFSVGCHLDLKHIALHGSNVEFRRENGMVTMKLRKPYTTASMWSSGKITCTGSTSEAEAKVSARRVARYLQKQLEYKTRLINFRVVNVLGTCTMPFSIKIADFSQKYPRIACYEPELHPGVTYRVKHLSATLKVFSTGSITVTAPSVSAVQQAIEHIFPLVYEFRKDKSTADSAAAAARARTLYVDSDCDDDEEEEEDDEDLLSSDEDD